MPTVWSKLHPAIPRHWLYGIAGAVWTAVGLLLGTRAMIWLNPFPAGTTLLMVLAGVAVAVGAHTLLFRRIVKRNIRRISDLPESVCLFAFTAWSGYFIIILMATLGYLLRNSPIPKTYLVVPYAAMGGVLLLGSVNFFRAFYSGWIAVREGKGR